MKNKPGEVYFAADEAENLILYVKKKSETWFDSLTNNDYLEKIKKSWQSYYGFYYENGHEITFGGETGELVNLPVNHYRNIASHMLNMVTSTRPAFQAKSINTDSKSQIQTILANSLLEYYMRDKRLESDLKKAVEFGIVMGSGYIKMNWNATTGQIYDYVEPEYEYDEDGNQVFDDEGNAVIVRDGVPLYEGDIEFEVLDPFNVVFDPNRGNGKHDWQLCRSFKNKYDFIAKYPEYKDKILGLKTKNQNTPRSKINLTPFDETNDVAVYEFFHKPTESLPKGRYVLYLDSDIILEDTVMIYKNLPIFKLSAAEILGTPFSYTSMFDLLPIQEAVNSLYSTIMTNQTNFGVQNVYVEKGSDVQVEQISGGMNFIQGNPGFNPPQPLNLTTTPGEIFNFTKMLEQVMETLSGVNSVVRGNPESNLKSGNALALIQSQSLQFISGLQQSYIQLIEDVGTNIVELLKTFAKTPRIAAIAGVSNSTYIKEFNSDDLSTINRVIVDVGNALANSTAGRVEIASQMMQMGIIKNPEQYNAVITTGKLETMTEGANKELLLIRAERERLIDGRTPVIAVLTDDHSLHIREHSSVLADPDLRMDDELVARTLSHIQQHIDLLSNPDVANILSMLGQQPLSAPGGTPNAPQNLAPPQPNQAGQEQIPPLLENPQAQSVSAIDPEQNLPQPATPAGSGTILPEQPQTAADVFRKNT